MGIVYAARMALLAFKTLPKGFKALSWMGLGAAAMEAAESVTGKSAPTPELPAQALDNLEESFRHAGLDPHAPIAHLTETQVGLMLEFLRTNPLINLLFRGTLGDESARTFVSYIEQGLLQRLGELTQVREEESVEQAALRIRQLTGWPLRSIVDISRGFNVLQHADEEDVERLKSPLKG